MDQRDYHYYRVNAATINLDEIASCERNAKTLQRLRDGDEELNRIILSEYPWYHNSFAIKAGMEDEVGWLGYFIGKSRCLQELSIRYWPMGEGGEQQSRALVEGIARNHSIRKLDVCPRTGFFRLRHEEFSIICEEVLINLSQLEVLDLGCELHYLGYDGPSFCSALGTALRSGTMKLKELSLYGVIGEVGADSLENGFARIGPFLKTLDLRRTSIGNDNLMALVRALANSNCTGLEILYLSENDFSSAAAGLGSLSDWLQRNQMNLKELYLGECGINDDGLQALAEGGANHCEELFLSFNDSITATGLRHLSHALQFESCRLQRLYLDEVEIGDDGAEALAAGLAGNQSLRFLHIYGRLMTPIGWSAFSTVLCDTSSINNTYLSNHTIELCWDDGYEDDDEIIDESRALVYAYALLNKQHPQHAARCKILMSHPHLDMKPFLRWDLKFLPLAFAWFERAKPCTTLTIQTSSFDRNSMRSLVSARRVLEEPDEAFQSRVLTAMYQFVRERSCDVLERREELLVAAYNDKIAMAEEEIKRLVNEKKRLLRDNERLRENIEQRDRKIARRDRKIVNLEGENKRLGNIVRSVRHSLSSLVGKLSLNNTDL